MLYPFPNRNFLFLRASPSYISGSVNFTNEAVYQSINLSLFPWKIFVNIFIIITLPSHLSPILSISLLVFEGCHLSMQWFAACSSVTGLMYFSYPSFLMQWIPGLAIHALSTLKDGRI